MIVIVMMTMIMIMMVMMISEREVGRREREKEGEGKKRAKQRRKRRKEKEKESKRPTKKERGLTPPSSWPNPRNHFTMIHSNSNHPRGQMRRDAHPITRPHTNTAAAAAARSADS